MSYSRGARELLKALGITNEKLPVEGLMPRELFGVTFWIDALAPKAPGARFRNFRLRVKCKCAKCGLPVAASRLHQHVDTARCVGRVLGIRQ